MAPRPRWWHQLQASKSEVLLAVDLYNRSGQERQLEAFIVHMSIGWLKLLQAHAEHTGGDVFTRDDRGRRMRHKDGDWGYKPLSVLISDYLGEKDPRRRNLEFMVGLRNKIEHRFEGSLASVVAGRTQALLLNYELTLIEYFSEKEALGGQLRFPVFISTLTDDAAAALKQVRSQVPKGVIDWLQDFDAQLEPTLSADQQFDFRIYLIPHTGPKTEADAAMTFVKMDALSDEQRAVMNQVQTIIREKHVPVSDLDALRVKDVVGRVSASIPHKFTQHVHTQCWRYFGVRPAEGSTNKAMTKADFCRYNAAFEQYVYTEAWVTYLIRKLGDETIYDEVLAFRASSEENAS